MPRRKKKTTSREAAEAGKKANKAGPQAKQAHSAPVVQQEAQPPSPPQQTETPVVCFDPYAPRVEFIVTHRVRDEQGRRYGHVGIVQKRAPAKMAKYGGKEYASWAQLTRDGVPDPYAERFETFETEVEALSHAKYASSVTP